MKKKFLWISVIIVIIFSLFAIYISRHREPDYSIGNDKFKIINILNHKWKFIVTKSNTHYIDTLILNSYFKSGNNDNLRFRWILITFDSLKSNSLIDTVYSVINVSVDKNNYVEIPNPTNKYLKLTEAIPSPQLKFPIELGHPINTKTKVKITSNEELKGITVTGKIEVKGKIYYDNPIVKDSCLVLDVVGNSKLGTFKAKYYFHEKYGFVYFYFDFVKYQVEINIISYK